MVSQPETPPLTELHNKRLELWLGFWKVVMGTFLIGIATAIVNYTIQDKEIRLKELQYRQDLALKKQQFEKDTLGTYLDAALDDDQNKRIRLASYFAYLTESEGTSNRWRNYLVNLESEAQRQEELFRTKSRDLSDALYKVRVLSPEIGAARLRLLRQSLDLIEILYRLSRYDLWLEEKPIAFGKRTEEIFSDPLKAFEKPINDAVGDVEKVVNESQQVLDQFLNLLFFPTTLTDERKKQVFAARISYNAQMKALGQIESAILNGGSNTPVAIEMREIANAFRSDAHSVAQDYAQNIWLQQSFHPFVRQQARILALAERTIVDLSELGVEVPEEILRRLAPVSGIAPTLAHENFLSRFETESAITDNAMEMTQYIQHIADIIAFSATGNTAPDMQKATRDLAAAQVLRGY